MLIHLVWDGPIGRAFAALKEALEQLLHLAVPRSGVLSMLRLAGVNLSTLRRVIALEAVVPLLSGVVIAAGGGLAAAALFLRAQTDYSLQPPGPHYIVLLAIGVVTALAIIASTLPLLDRSTGPDGARL
jgi:Mg/Co/Ni transporter MgtE